MSFVIYRKGSFQYLFWTYSHIGGVMFSHKLGDATRFESEDRARLAISVHDVTNVTISPDSILDVVRVIES